MASLAFLATLAGFSCRRAPHFVRGDAAAVVVVPRPRDAGGAPPVAEREPNNTQAQAQELTWVGTPSAVTINGRIDRPEAGKAADIDVFKLVVPGERVAAFLDAGQALRITFAFWPKRRPRVAMLLIGGCTPSACRWSSTLRWDWRSRLSFSTKLRGW